MARIDIVTVFHNERNRVETQELARRLLQLEKPDDFTLTAIDNSVDNRGFSKACNLGAKVGAAPIIGFLNPDVSVRGRFIDSVVKQLAQPDVVITGNRYGKSTQELKTWGVTEWVCGATMFVRRDFWEESGGFDEQFVWGWEETDLIRRAELAGKKVAAVHLPINHASPEDDDYVDGWYKNHHFTQAGRRYFAKWR